MILQTKICATPASQKQFRLISDRGQHFVFCPHREIPGLANDSSSKYRKTNGNEDCNHREGNERLCQRFHGKCHLSETYPAVKTRFMLGFGKSKPSVTENLYIVKESFNQVGIVTLCKWHRMFLCSLCQPTVPAASLPNLLRPAPPGGPGAVPGPLQTPLCILGAAPLGRRPGSSWR